MNNIKFLEKFFPIFISALTAILGLSIQFIFYSKNLDLNFLNASLAEISVPFFGISLLLVVLREDLIKSDIGEELLKANKLPTHIFRIILYSSLAISFLSLLQSFSVKAASLSFVYSFCNLYIFIFVARLKVNSNRFLPLLINIMILIFVCSFLLFFSWYGTVVSLLEIYALSVLIIFILIFLNLGLLEHTESLNVKVDFNNVLRNLLFVIAPLIEGYLYYYFNDNSYSHLAFINRACIVITGIFVNYIFFYFDKFKRIKSKAINIRFLIAPFIISLIFILLALVFMQFNIFSLIFESMNLNTEKIYLLSMLIIPAYIFNAFTYVLFRLSGGRLHTTSFMILILILYTFILSLIIYGKFSIYVYGITYLSIWSIIFLLSYFTYTKPRRSL